jgi:uroporphyrinogen decarboxylase
VSSGPFRDRFLRACRLQPVDRTPVWFMRQAGRYLAEYRELRSGRDVLETCRDPAQVVEITLQPLRRMDVDAAIVFSDIMVPLAAIGIDVRVEPGRGPIVATPIRSEADVERLRPLEPEQDVPAALEAIRLLRKELQVPLIGFAGAPFTLASYLIEGGPSRNHEHTKTLMHADHLAWDALMRALVAIVVPHLRAQAEAGAQALQVFDSWVGALDRDDYRRRVQPHMSSLFAGLADLGVPVIHFGVGTGELLGEMAIAGGNVLGIDWRVPLDEAWDRVGHDRAVQGNLDPAVLGAPWEIVERKTIDVLRRADGRDGHVFNLGHGVLPGTPPDTLARLVDFVHSETSRGASRDETSRGASRDGTSRGASRDETERKPS